MKYQLITLFVIVSVCHGQKKVADSIDVNGHNDSIPDVTDIAPSGTTTPVPTPTTKTTSATTPATTTTNGTTPTTSATPTTNGTTTEKPTPTTKSTTTPAPAPTTTNRTTTSTTTTLKPTPAPTVTTKEPPTKAPVTTVAPTPASNRKFDGPSFVGGIVLASGLMAIGFVAFKFYKARTELNYHTL